jgi:hypothetical protein
MTYVPEMGPVGVLLLSLMVEEIVAEQTMRAQGIAEWVKTHPIEPGKSGSLLPIPLPKLPSAPWPNES